MGGGDHPTGAGGGAWRFTPGGGMVGTQPASEIADAASHKRSEAAALTGALYMSLPDDADKAVLYSRRVRYGKIRPKS